jgi:hypothetical protein
VRARPTWLLVLSLAMLVLGGIRLVVGVKMVREPAPEATAGDEVSVQALHDLATIRKAEARVFEEHPISVGLSAASRIVTGLVLLLAVAAIATSHPRARLASLAAAWAIILSTVGDWTFYLLVARRGTVDAAPAWADLIATSSGAGPAPSPGACVTMIDFAAITAGLLCVVFSVVLLRFFGGHRGRTFFGVGAENARST